MMRRIVGAMSASLPPSFTLMEQDPMSRVACETSITTGLVLVMGEITTNAYVDIQKIVRETIREIGYDRAKYGFDTAGVASETRR